jgi:hypothetical protein
MGLASLALNIGVFCDFIHSILLFDAILGLDSSGLALSWRRCAAWQRSCTPTGRAARADGCGRGHARVVASLSHSLCVHLATRGLAGPTRADGCRCSWQGVSHWWSAASTGDKCAVTAVLVRAVSPNDKETVFHSTIKSRLLRPYIYAPAFFTSPSDLQRCKHWNVHSLRDEGSSQSYPREVSGTRGFLLLLLYRLFDEVGHVDSPGEKPPIYLCEFPWLVISLEF